MKSKLFLSLLLAISFFLAIPTKTLAQSCDAKIANFDEGSRNLTVCIGGFSSPTELRSATAHINCVDNSNLIGQGCRGTGGQFFSGLESVDYSLAGTPNSDIVQGSDGYYTCPIIQEINRAVGKMNVGVTGSRTCTTPEAVIKPGNWNSLLEGNIFGQAAQGIIPTPGNVSAGAAGCVASSGTQGINTALGCISFDAESGGFVRSLLGVLIGLGGGVALLLILYGVFIVTTSAGIPDKLNQGKEIISSAVAGLVFIILAIFLMQLIGVQILALPGL